MGTKYPHSLIIEEVNEYIIMVGMLDRIREKTTKCCGGL